MDRAIQKFLASLSVPNTNLDHKWGQRGASPRAALSSRTRSDPWGQVSLSYSGLFGRAALLGYLC